MRDILSFQPTHGAMVIKLRRATTTDWVEANPVLAEGEPVLDTTERTIRIGDGVTPWADLPERWDFTDILYWQRGSVTRGPGIGDF